MQNWLADHKRTDWQIDCWLIDRQTDKEGDQLIDAQKVTWKKLLTVANLHYQLSRINQIILSDARMDWMIYRLTNLANKLTNTLV